MALLKPEALTYGHYECRFLDETLPVFTDLLSSEVVSRTGDAAVVRHPNTAWALVVHEGGASAPVKPHANHYGYRVADHKEIDAAADYLRNRQEDYGLANIDGPRGSHFAYSVYIDEPGGNTIEIEYYNPRASQHGRRIAAGHWNEPLPAGRFPGRGYVPQALSHGTMQCDDKEASNRFFTEALGLDIVGGGNVSTYIGVADYPWYIVVLPAATRTRLRPVNRYALKLASPAAVLAAHDALGRLGPDVADVGELREESAEAWFVLADLNGNWWEITSSSEPNLLALT